MKTIKNIISVNEKKILLLIFIIALTLRLIAIINLPSRYQIPVTDAKQYDDLAVSLLTGKGYVFSDTGFATSWRVPLYPLFLAAIYSIFGHNYFAARVIQCIMSSLLCVIIFHIAKIVFDRKVALLSAAIIAFYQPFIFYASWSGPAFLLSENLFIFLLALFVLFLIKNLFVQFNFKNSAISGVLMGLLTLTRPIFALFPIFIFALLFYKNKYPLITTLKKILPLLISFVLVIMPWTARNYLVHKAFVPFSTEGGFALLASNNPHVKGGGLISAERLFTEEQRNQLSKMSEVEKDRAYRQRALELIFKNYKKLPKLCFKKLLVMWDVFINDYGSDDPGKRRYNIWYSAVLMFSLFGIATSIRPRLNIDSFLLISLFLYISVIAMIFSGAAIWRNPIEPYLIIFASVGIFAIYNRFTNKFLSSIIIGIIIGINFLFYLYSDLILSWIRYLLKRIGI